MACQLKMRDWQKAAPMRSLVLGNVLYERVLKMLTQQQIKTSPWLTVCQRMNVTTDYGPKNN